MAVTLGTDVSHYQGTIDWAAVGRTSYRFALARMTIGRTTKDEQGRRNLSLMVGQVPVAGVYGVCGYSEPVEDGAKLLLDEVAAVGADPDQILIMLDAEDFGDGRHPTIDQVDRYAIQLHAELGRWPTAYVPAWWLSKHGYTVAGRSLAKCPWAPSHYISAPWSEDRLLAFKPADLHGFDSLAWLQYTSSASCAGISGSIDANCFYGTLDELRARLLGVAGGSDLTMADAQTIMDAINQLRTDLTVFGTTGLENTVESYAARIRNIEAKLGVAASTEASILATVKAIIDQVKTMEGSLAANVDSTRSAVLGAIAALPPPGDVDETEVANTVVAAIREQGVSVNADAVLEALRLHPLAPTA